MEWQLLRAMALPPGRLAIDLGRSESSSELRLAGNELS
jgi:hypothetical protein